MLLTNKWGFIIFSFNGYLKMTASIGSHFENLKSQYLQKQESNKKVNRNVQEEPQAEVAANPWHQVEEKKWHRLTCA